MAGKKKVTVEERRAYDDATERDNYTCVRCGRGGHAQRDHRQNRMNGNTVVSNLQLLCAGCHLWKTVHPADALSEGWAMPRHTLLSPSEWPARRWLPTSFGTLRKAWVRYFDAVRGGEWWEEISDAEASNVLAAAGIRAEVWGAW